MRNAGWYLGIANDEGDRSVITDRQRKLSDSETAVEQGLTEPQPANH
jgi:hypothetical protein